jgi:hypothetical protein
MSPGRFGVTLNQHNPSSSVLNAQVYRMNFLSSVAVQETGDGLFMGKLGDGLSM